MFLSAKTRTANNRDNAHKNHAMATKNHLKNTPLFKTPFKNACKIAGKAPPQALK